jgi:uncharacterized membrane protein YjfL (UPF0719 family)
LRRGEKLAGTELYTSLLLWFGRALVSSLICLALGYIGIKVLTLETTKIKEFETIKGNALATSLFVSGFLVYSGLVIYGSMVNPFFLSQSILIGSYFNVQRLLVVIISFAVSLLFGFIFYTVFARLKPFGMDLEDINKQPVAVGVFLFSYEIFLGIVMLASLTIPIG